MSSFHHPKVSSPVFVPRNRYPQKGLTIGYHEGVPPAAQLDTLNALGVPLLCRMPVQTFAQAQRQLDALLPYPNLSALLLVENITADPSWSFDHAKLAYAQFGNETDLAPYDWTPAQFAERTLTWYRAWRAAGFTKRIVSGGIFSVEAQEPGGDWHAHAYLTPLLAQAPRDLVIGVHWYGDSSDAWKDKLAALTAGFDVGVSEYGLPSRTPAEDHAQTLYLSGKDRDFYVFGALFTCVYQAASGPNLSNLDNFGLWRADGSAKPGLSCLGEKP